MENIKFFKENSIQLSVSYTISNLNIFYYNETVEWFNKQGLRHNHNLVTYPNHFSVNALPEKIKLGLNQELFGQHNVNDDANFSLFLKEIQQQDQLKNILIEDYLPEFYELIKESI